MTPRFAFPSPQEGAACCSYPAEVASEQSRFYDHSSALVSMAPFGAGGALIWNSKGRKVEDVDALTIKDGTLSMFFSRVIFKLEGIWRSKTAGGKAPADSSSVLGPYLKHPLLSTWLKPTDATGPVHRFEVILEDAASKLGWDLQGALANLKGVIKQATPRNWGC